jgi:hypothetical protein
MAILIVTATEALTFERAPSGPLSSTVFLQFKQLHESGLHRLPALKQSQYKAMHFDFGQLHPEGFSCKGPSSSVAEQSKSSLSNRPSIISPFDRFNMGEDSDLFDVSVERFPRLPSVGESALVSLDASSLGITTLGGMITVDRNREASIDVDGCSSQGTTF